MTASAADGRTLPSPRSHAVLLLQAYGLCLMLLPSDQIIDAIGAEGYAASLVAIVMFMTWGAAILLDLHDPLACRHPIRASVAAVWVVSLASYALMHLSEQPGVLVRGGDRWLMQLVAITGVVLVAAECLRSREEITRVLRAVVWGGAACGMVAVLQFWLTLDLSAYARMVPGFSINAENVAISTRSALHRVAGTAIHPIELGVVSGMLFPLALHLLIHDHARQPWKRWLPLAVIGVAIPLSVSRSGIISVTLAAGVFVVLLPVTQRLVALAAAPIALVSVFMVIPGLISTVASFFTAGTSDTSVASRVQDYPFVESMVSKAPWFGKGGGTFFPTDAFEILDNQYLKTSIELGLVGLAVVAVLYFLVPPFVALTARRRSADPELRSLTAALAGSATAAVVCSLAFDSLSFPMFSGVHALVLGLIGACWLLTDRASDTAEDWNGQHHPSAATSSSQATTAVL